MDHRKQDALRNTRGFDRGCAFKLCPMFGLCVGQNVAVDGTAVVRVGSCGRGPRPLGNATGAIKFNNSYPAKC